MATLTTAHNYSNTFLGLATQLGLSSSILLYCVLQFEWNRHQKSMQYLYTPRTRLSKNASPPIPPGPFSWIKASIFLSDDFYLENAGLDALMYIRFLKMAFQFLLFNLMIVGPILLPINYYAGGIEEGVSKLSISNIPSGTLDTLWAHTICTYLVSLSWMYLLYTNYCDYISMFRRHLLNRVECDPVTARTVMVSRIPRDLRSEEKLQEFVENLGLGPVESTIMVRLVGKLDRKISRREKALLALEKAHIKLAKNVCNAIRRRKFGIRGRLFGRRGENPSIILEAGETREHQRVQSIMDWLDPRKRKRSANGENQNNRVTKNATISSNGTFVNENIMEHEDGYGQQFLIWNSLSQISKSSLDKYQPVHRTGFMGNGKNVRLIDNLLKKFNYLDRRIAELRSMPINAAPYKATSTGFVTFRDHISAQLCAQSIMSSRPHTCTTKMAPEPRDLLWDNLFMRFREKMIRTIIVNSCVWALTIFWLFPIVAFLTLTSFDSLSQRIRFLGPFLEAAPIIKTLLQNVLPTVLVSFFMAILPWILMELSKQECFPSYSDLEESVLVRYYYFSLFNVFIVFLLGITFLQSIFDVINAPTSIFEVLATNLPQGATFFINYVIFNTCTHGLELVQVGSQIFLHIILTSRFVATTPRMLQRVTHPWAFQFYYYYPIHILVLVITITYSTINPLILVFALIYYAIALLVFKHQFAYCYVRRYEAGGKFYRRVFRYTTDGLIIFQLTVIGMIWLRTAIIQGACLVPLLIGTGYFKYYCHKTFYSRTHFLALDTRIDVTNVERDDRTGDINIQTEKPATELPESSHQNNHDARKSANTNSREGALVNAGSMFRRKSAGDGFRRLEDSESSMKDNNNKGDVRIDSTENFPRTENPTENPVQRSFDEDFNNDVENASATLQDQESLVTSGNADIPAVSSNTSEPTSQEKEIQEAPMAISQTTDSDKKIESNGIDSNPVTRPNMKLLIVPSNNAPLVSSPDSYFVSSAHRLSSRASRVNFRNAVRSTNNPEQDDVSQYQTYTHPNLVKALSRKLWLPCDPFKKICLDDTVELSRALTSSEGGVGVVGYLGEASQYLGEARVSIYGIHEFPISPSHQRGATGGTIGEFGTQRRRKVSEAIPEGSNEGDDDNLSCNYSGPLSPEEEGVVSLNEFVSGELESGELTSGEEF